jgi:hypothetical protein
MDDDAVHEQELLEIALQHRRLKRYIQLEDTAVYLWGFYANVRLTVLATQDARIFVRPESEDFSFPIDREDVYHYEELLEAREVVRRRRQMIEQMLAAAE